MNTSFWNGFSHHFIAVSAFILDALVLQTLRDRWYFLAMVTLFTFNNSISDKKQQKQFIADELICILSYCLDMLQITK